MATRKTAVSKLTGAAKDHFEKTWLSSAEKQHGKNFKYITRRTHKQSGAVDYILFHFGAVKTKQGVINAYEPHGVNFDFQKVKTISTEKEFFANWCMEQFGSATPNA